MGKASRFLLRIDPALYQRLREQAKRLGVSLNQYLVERLDGDPTHNELAILRRVWGKNLIGVIQFGSSVRGEMRADSDIDLLLVMSSQVAIDRNLYRKWDTEIASNIDPRYSPQFSAYPASFDKLSGLWLEVGLEGIVLEDTQGQLQQALSQIRDRIASGEYRRSVSHGHPYWVSLKEQNDAEPGSRTGLRHSLPKTS